MKNDMRRLIHTQTDLMQIIGEMGFLPLLDSGIRGFSADEMADEDCCYVVFPEGGWEWKLWEWKGSVITEGGFVYGKFFDKKAGFISKEWWPDFMNYRRSRMQKPEEGSIEDMVLMTLRENGSMVTRELRNACGFTGKNMRSRFDSFITKLQMGTFIVTEDFVYPVDKHGNQYGWGLSLLTTPESLYGKESCSCERTPAESYQRIFEHFREILPEANDKQIKRLIG